ncbi:MAG: SRPBCC domain-containing protein [Acidobacteria bacterium]|nr:SRPBCC domain-containing protein [Acidobacteriota bacterium]
MPPVIKTVTVACTPEEAFRYFTVDFGRWWPLATHSCIAFASDHKDTPASCVLEGRRGGRLLERGRSGEEHVWGTVLIWEPPSRVAFSWHPMRDEATAQKVEVRFSAVREGTKVVLTHSGWERLGDDAGKERDGYNEGWEAVFVSAYSDYVRGRL